MESRLLDEVHLLPKRVGTLAKPSSAAPATERRPVRPAYHGRIPRFPAFKPLELTDQLAVESWVKRFPPYSDFNFVSLWAWNTDNTIELSWLNDNLVVKFKDYESPNQFYSFLGTTDVVSTAVTLLDTARRSGVDSRLHLIPEFVVAQTPELLDWVRVVEERPHGDHVLSTEEWSTLAGGRFRNKRNVISQLERTRAPEFRPIDAGDTEIQRAIQAVFGRWAVQRNCVGQEGTVLQAVSLKRLFSLDRPGDLLSYGVFIDDDLCAFSINEPLSGGYAMGHFWRADLEIPGLYPYLLRELSRALLAAGYRYLNTMQDLGQPGLAYSKHLNRPHHFLRKYVIAPLEDVEVLAGAHFGGESIRILVEMPPPMVVGV